MKLFKLNDTENLIIVIMEYTLNDTDINCATVAIMGKYLDKGYCINEKYKELIYVI